MNWPLHHSPSQFGILLCMLKCRSPPKWSPCNTQEAPKVHFIISLNGNSAEKDRVGVNWAFLPKEKRAFVGLGRGEIKHCLQVFFVDCKKNVIFASLKIYTFRSFPVGRWMCEYLTIKILMIINI